MNVGNNVPRYTEVDRFRLTVAEKAEVITHCDHLRPLRFSPALPYAFTEHGAIMLASVLNTPIAVQASVQVVRAFVRLREMLGTQRPSRQILFDAIRQLMAPSEKAPRSIGFRVER